MTEQEKTLFQEAIGIITKGDLNTFLDFDAKHENLGRLKSKNGTTLLHIASGQHQEAVVFFLAQNGGDINAKTKYGIPPSMSI